MTTEDFEEEMFNPDIKESWKSISEIQKDDDYFFIFEDIITNEIIIYNAETRQQKTLDLNF